MPKIIKNLEEKILIVAQETFLHANYEDVEMKKIASKVGIAVGTVYNYYPNKLFLFLKVYDRISITNVNKIREINSLDIMPKEKLIKVFLYIYDSIDNYKNLDYGIIYKNYYKNLEKDQTVIEYVKEISDRTFNEVKSILIEIISNMNYKKLNNEYIERFVPMMLFGIHHMNWKMDSETNNNIEFIKIMINKFIIEQVS